MSVEVLVTAIGIVLILEGLMPLISPATWRALFSQMLQLKDGQLRYVGLVSLVVGLILVFI